MSSWAVITGASSGLGEAFTRHLAATGSDVVLVARNEQAMRKIAAEVERAHNVQTMVVPTDLADGAQRAGLIGKLDELEVHTLVNNAGFGTLGRLAELERGRISDEIEVNVTALTELSHAVIPQMLQRDRGAIVNVASTAAFQPVPEMATYAATKSYVLNFSNALWGELRGTGVRVVCICPGPTETGFFENLGDESVMSNRRRPQDVIATTFRALDKRQPYAVDGARNKLLAQAGRFVPTTLALRIANWVATH